MDNVSLVFDDDALDFIVDKAIEYKLGARGLRGLMESVMTDLMFDLPSHKKIGASKSFTVTKAFVQEKLDRARLTRLQKAG